MTTNVALETTMVCLLWTRLADNSLTNDVIQGVIIVELYTDHAPQVCSIDILHISY